VTRDRSTQVWFCYVVRAADGSLYTGITCDINRRLLEHNGAAKRGAKALRGKRPVTLLFSVELADRGQASRLEWKIKQLDKATKERLVKGDIKVQELDPLNTIFPHSEQEGDR